MLARAAPGLAQGHSRSLTVDGHARSLTRPMDLAALNPPQRQAVTYGRGPLMVLAGAGSGKTRVITYRIAHLLARGDVSGREIAALTFTNKAAIEMRERVAELLGNPELAAELTIGTFHSLGLNLLRAEHKVLGYPRSFVIYDAADQMGAVREILRRVDMGGRRFDVKAILTRISLAKNAFISPDDFDPVDGDEYDEIAAEVYPRYQESLRAYAAVDFDDLITEPVRLLDEDSALRRRWRKRFRHVLVDEYQDTNRAQLLLVRHLVADHKNLCVVGDDDQSIYSWRGAEPAAMLDFVKQFKGAELIKLEQNYRSTPTILAAANAVIGNNQIRHEKTLWTARPDGPKITCAIAPDAATEARFVAREIDSLRQSGTRLSDCAVLYRSNIQTRELEDELRAAEVAYVVYGGQQFFERKEVKDVIAYLRVALNARDEIALRRIINYPARGIGATTIGRLSSWAEAKGKPLWNALAAGESLQHRANTSHALASFVAVIRRLRTQLNGRDDIVAATRALIDDIDLVGDIRAASPSVTAAQRRLDNLEGLLASLERHQQRRPGRTALLEYLRQLSLDSNDDNSELERSERVILTTLHGAKGLEFPVVFVVGMEESLIPHARTLMPQATDVFDPDHTGDVSEERRLAYVGITRAQRRLYLSRCAHRKLHGKASERAPSRFLAEIPTELCEERDLVAEGEETVDSDELTAWFRQLGSD